MSGPGWVALEEHLAARLPGRQPVHFDAAVPMHLGGPRPLDRVSAYALDDPPHWLYVTYGLSELHQKKSRRADRSGWGFELAFRLARTELAPPRWPLDLLQGLASYVYASRNPFAPGAQMDLNGPIQAGTGTRLTAALFDADPQLGELDTPHGHLRFLELVPVHAGELEACAAWSAHGLLGLLPAPRVTDLARASLLEDPAAAARIAEATAREGSAMGTQSLDTLAWRKDGQGVRLSLGAYAIESVRGMLTGRTLHGRRFVLEGPAGLAVFDPADANGWRTEDRTLIVTLTPLLARAMHDSLSPKRGKHRWPELKGFTLEIEPTEIRDPEGKVLRTIG